MISFESDYIAGAHPRLLQRLIDTNMDIQSGYGFDRFSESAAKKIAEACNCPDAQICFLVGGTQTNEIVISQMLRSYEGVIAADTGHVSLHEAGAIEHTGHKVLQIHSEDSKLHAADIEAMMKKYLGDESCEHMVRPGMVYITHPTEFGMLYSKAELKEIAQVSRKYDLPVYLDGARMGYGLMSRETDVTLADIAEYTDVFYIGGTKVGALCGEALVYTKKNMPEHFLSIIKQNGALLAKGRLCGVQFDELFTDGLYYEIGKHGIDMAERMKKIFRDKGYTFYAETPTNQQFILLEDGQMEKLREKVSFCFWEKPDDTHTAVRFATAWSTTDADLDYLESVL